MIVIDQGGSRIRVYCREHRTLSAITCAKCVEDAQRKAASLRRLAEMFMRHPELKARGRKEAV